MMRSFVQLRGLRMGIARHYRFLLTLPLALAFALSSGCARYASQRGVDVTWDATTLGSFERGVTTRGEVMAALGPPSQLVNLGDESVLYYLNEAAQGEGLILLVYNRFDVLTRYDRAVFIFDDADRLSDFSGYIAPSDSP
jgi:outer membrane protein assembly factor BamE (lipoprotein component of BamABCDE complex)